MEKYFNTIRKHFDGLFSCKFHKDCIEVITPFACINDKFVSVFLFSKNDRYIVADAGWVEEIFSEVWGSNNLPEICTNAIEKYKNYYDVEATSSNGRTAYFKKCNDEKMISAIVFDMASFISKTVDACYLHCKIIEDATG